MILAAARHLRTSVPFAAAFGIVMVLTGCAGNAEGTIAPDRASSTPARQLAPATPPLLASPFASTPTIGPVIWTTAKGLETRAPSDAVPRYFTDAPGIVALMPAANLPRGVQVEASWSYNSTPLETLATRIAVNDGPSERWLTFHLDRSSEVPWPSGVYEIDISLNGVLMQHASVEVVAPG